MSESQPRETTDREAEIIAIKNLSPLNAIKLAREHGYIIQAYDPSPNVPSNLDVLFTIEMPTEKKKDREVIRRIAPYEITPDDVQSQSLLEKIDNYDSALSKTTDNLRDMLYAEKEYEWRDKIFQDFRREFIVKRKKTKATLRNAIYKIVVMEQPIPKPEMLSYIERQTDQLFDLHQQELDLIEKALDIKAPPPSDSGPYR